MKKKLLIVIPCIIVVLLVVIAIIVSQFMIYRSWFHYFPWDKSELLQMETSYDKAQAAIAINKVHQAFSFNGTAQEAEEKFGRLGLVCSFITNEFHSDYSVRQTYKIDVFKSNFQENQGKIWFTYYKKYFNAQNEQVGETTRNGLHGCVEFEKINGEWEIVGYHEPA